MIDTRFLAIPILLLASPEIARGQWRYLGSGDYSQTLSSPKYGIPWQGDFSGVTPHRLSRSEERLTSLSAPSQAGEDLAAYPGADVGQWIDDGWDRALKVFTDCGGSVADKARSVEPAGYFVQVQATIWQTAASSTGWAVGETVPSGRLIKVTCFYFSEGLRQEQWLPTIIGWEQQNHIAIEIGVAGEPGSSPHWPCDAADAIISRAAFE